MVSYFSDSAFEPVVPDVTIEEDIEIMI